MEMTSHFHILYFQLWLINAWGVKEEIRREELSASWAIHQQSEPN